MALTKLQANAIATGAVTSSAIADGTVVAADILDGTVTNAKLTNEIDIKGNLTIQAGTAETPSLVANSDPNTGIYFPSADNLAISTGGKEVGIFDSVGYFKSTYSDNVIALGNTGTNPNIDMSLGTVFTATLNDDAVFTVANARASGASSFSLILTNDGTPSRSVSWAGGTFLFPQGSASLARTETAGNTDVWFFFTPDGGTNFYGSLPMKDLAT